MKIANKHINIKLLESKIGYDKDGNELSQYERGYAAGEALHTGQDATSPTHRGATKYKNRPWYHSKTLKHTYGELFYPDKGTMARWEL
jgi:hypothetical protein